MKTITLSNGVKMPLFGLGTFKVEPGQSAQESVKMALEIGYRHIDTAKMYYNEYDVGLAILSSKVNREDIFITTKQKENYGGDKDKIKADIEDSFVQLNVDYIDLLLIHWPDHNPKINAIFWSVLEDYYFDGRIKAIGVSNFNIHHLEELKKTAKIMPMVNQIELHPGLQQWRNCNYAKDENIVITSYGPFMKGGVYQGELNEQLAQIAKKYNATVAQIIIAWGIQRNIVMIPKSVKYERLVENFKGQDITLADEDMQAIKALNRGFRVYTDPDNNPFFPY